MVCLGGRGSLEGGGGYFSLAGLGGVASRPLLERDLLLCLMCIFKLGLRDLGLKLLSLFLHNAFVLGIPSVKKVDCRQ